MYSVPDGSHRNKLHFVALSLLVLVTIPYTVGVLLKATYVMMGIVVAMVLYESVWSYSYGNKGWFETIGVLKSLSLVGESTKMDIHAFNGQVDGAEPASGSYQQLFSTPNKASLTTKRIKTGNEKLNRSIETLILVIMKEYVSYYYSPIAADSVNYTYIYETLVLMAQEITSMIISNNWTAFFSLKMNYELLTHVKIYLRSLERSEFNLINPQNKIQHKKCLEEYFNIEKEATRKSFEKICFDNNHLFNYFYNLLSMVLYHLLPENEFQNKLIRYSLQNVLASQMVQIINKISEPTFINKFFITQLDKFEWFTAESLLDSIRYLADSKDINCLRSLITIYMAKLAGNDDSLKSWSKDIFLMNELERVSQIQFDLLKTGTITIRTEEILQSECESDDESKDQTGSGEIDYFDPLTNPNIVHFNVPALPYNYIIENMDSRNSFQQFLSENKLFHYFNLQLSLKLLKTKYQPQVESAAYKSGLFLLRDPIVNEYHTDVSTLIKDFKLDRNNEQFQWLENSFFNEFQHILCEKCVDLLRLEKLHSIVDSLLASNAIYGRFTHTKIYLEMCVHLRLLESTCLDRYDILIKSEDSQPTAAQLSNVKPSNAFAFVSINIIKFENQQLNNKSVTVYVVEVVVQKKLVKETLTIYRRYSEFLKFYTLLSAKFPQVKNFGFPKKNTILGDNKRNEFVQKRKALLNNFISKLLNFEYCKSNEKFIDEMRQFFTCPKWQSQMSASSFIQINSICNNDEYLSKSDDNLGCDDNTPAMPLSTTSSTPNIYELGGATSQRKENNTTSCDITYNGDIYNNELITLAKKLNPDFVEEQTLVIFIQLVEEIAGLKQFNWITRKWAGGLKQFILATYGDKFSKYLVDCVSGLLTSECAVTYVNTLRDCLVSYFEEETDSDTATAKAQFDEDSFARLTAILARIHFIGFNPSDAKKFISEENITFSVNKLFHMFQFKQLNKRLLLVLIEKFLVILFKEKSTQNFIDNI